MKRLFFLCALLALCACKPKSLKTISMETPIENDTFQNGETIVFQGKLDNGTLGFDEGKLRVKNLSTGEFVLDESFTSDYSYSLVNSFTDTTVLHVYLGVLVKDAENEDEIKSFNITCLP